MAQKPANPGALPEALGPYRRLRKLAVGGMGEVYLAEARGAGQFKKLLVIKAIRPDRAEEQEVVQAFLDEARIWALLTHPNIVPLYDCVQLEGRLCLVMEYVEGADLRELIQRASEVHRPVPAAIAVHLVAQVAAGLHAAHEARGLDGVSLAIVHRDVSPHNVLVDRGGNARLCDFGIARSVLRLTRTRTGKFKGKFAYVSPEAIRGEIVDRRADVFGLGVLLYELLALRRPFKGDGPVALLRAILDTEPVAIREVRRDVSVRLSHTIERALAKDVSARFPTAESMRQSLLETPEGQTFLGVGRLMDWFDGLTGASGDWNVTKPRMLDLAARSAARSLDEDGEAEGEASAQSFADAPELPEDDRSQAGAKALAGPWGDAFAPADTERPRSGIGPALLPGAGAADDELTERTERNGPASKETPGRAAPPRVRSPVEGDFAGPRTEERIEQPTARLGHPPPVLNHGPPLFKDTLPGVPLNERPAVPRSGEPDPTAATHLHEPARGDAVPRHPLRSRAAAKAEAKGPARSRESNPRSLPPWREYAPWVAGGLAAGGSLTWLLWRLF